MTSTIVVELIVHVILIEGLNRIARKSQWFIFAPLAFLVSGFMIFIILTIPVITPAGSKTVSGNLQSTGQDQNDWFAINLNGHVPKYLVANLFCA